MHFIVYWGICYLQGNLISNMCSVSHIFLALIYLPLSSTFYCQIGTKLELVSQACHSEVILMFKFMFFLILLVNHWRSLKGQHYCQKHLHSDSYWSNGISPLDPVISACWSMFLPFCLNWSLALCDLLSLFICLNGKEFTVSPQDEYVK